MNDFQATVKSLLHQVVAYIGEDHLVAVQVIGDEQTATATVAIQLHVDTWDEQSRAIDKMLDVCEMFLGELSIDYHFARGAEATASVVAEAFSSCVV